MSIYKTLAFASETNKLKRIPPTGVEEGRHSRYRISPTPERVSTSHDAQELSRGNPPYSPCSARGITGLYRGGRISPQ